MPVPEESRPLEDGRGGAQGEAPRPRYRLRPVTAPVPAPAEDVCADRQTAGSQAPSAAAGAAERASQRRDSFLRPAAEDDDGYDPFSDRPPAPEPAFQEDPWR